MSRLTPNPELLAQSIEALNSFDKNRLAKRTGSDDIAVHDPATGDEIATIPNHSVDDALFAVGVADEAGSAWARTTTRHRSDILHRVYAKLMENENRLALTIVREMGKPLAEARAEVQYAADYVRWYAEEALRAGGSFRDAPKGGSTLLSRRGPVGLALLITPWNFPMAMATRKIAPALAAGCAAVVKPATLTPLTTILTVQLMVEAGVPEDLVQVVTTGSASQFSTAVLGDPRVRKISFTGSTPVGATLMELAAKNIVKSSMELGGNAPFLVFDDADLERAIDGAILAKMRNGGQTCVAANRIMVQEGISDAFIEGFTEKMAAFVVGNPLAEGVTLGPMIDDKAIERLEFLTDDAVEKGASITTGGTKWEGPGSFFAPTVLTNVPDHAEINTTEIFGALASVSTFTSQRDAVAKANNTPFGLCGYVFTQDLDRALNVAEELETGIVGINQGMISNIAAPFGGVKQSGLGREGGPEGLEEYEEIRYFNVARRESE
jgi:succinate-semialdehyde dehydrogenase/glutarate-semialdehyde dehydrogenase